MRRIGLVSCAVASSALLAACGGSSSGGSSTTTSTPPTASSSSSSSFDKAAATSAAQGALLTLSDLPASWTSSPADNSQNKQLDTNLANCLGVDPNEFGDPGPDGASAHSPDFSPPGNSNSSVSESIDVASSSLIDQRFSVVESSKLPDCFDSVMGTYLKQQLAKQPSTRAATLGTPVTKTLNFTKLGDGTVAYGITIPFQIQGQQASVYIDLVFIRSSSTTGIEMFYSNILSPFDLSTAESIAQKAFSKVSSANIPS